MNMKKARARRQRIPAFGEWNYDDYGGAGDWPVTQYFDSTAIPAGLVMAALPPSPKKPPKKVVRWSDSAALELEKLQCSPMLQQQQQQVVVGEHYEPGAVKKQSRVADTGAHASPACNYRVAVKAVDKDLYEIPPDMLRHEPRQQKKRPTKGRSLWTGCLGLSCIA